MADDRRPELDVIARVNSALADEQIPVTRFAGLRPVSDTTIPGADRDGREYRRQILQITFRELTLPELGAFLRRWAQTQELWTPTQVHLAHVRDQTDPARFNSTIHIGATYLAQR